MDQGACGLGEGKGLDGVHRLGGKVEMVVVVVVVAVLANIAASIIKGAHCV